jgi:hypothetical protein
MGKWKYVSTLRMPRHKVKVSSQVHAPAALPPGKQIPVPIEQKNSCDLLSFWTLEEREKCLPPPRGIELGFPDFAMLFRFPRPTARQPKLGHSVDRPLKPFEHSDICVTRIHTHNLHYIYIYIYIFVCVCVCVCRYVYVSVLPLFVVFHGKLPKISEHFN